MTAARRPGAVLALLGLVLAGSAGCGPSGGVACVPELSVTPDDPRPGRIVTVGTTRACAGALSEGERWEVRIQPADRPIPVARAFVDPEPDGTFTVRITVPPTIGPGPAIAHIANYRVDTPCPGSARCAAPSVTFEVQP